MFNYEHVSRLAAGDNEPAGSAVEKLAELARLAEDNAKLANPPGAFQKRLRIMMFNDLSAAVQTHYDKFSRHLDNAKKVGSLVNEWKSGDSDLDDDTIRMLAVEGRADIGFCKTVGLNYALAKKAVDAYGNALRV